MPPKQLGRPRRGVRERHGASVRTIRKVDQRQAERLRGEIQTSRAAQNSDSNIVANASSTSVPAHTHTASNISDFSTAADARIANAVGDSVQAHAGILDDIATAGQQSAIASAAGGSTVDAEARAAINAVLAALRAQGLIET